MASSKKMRMFRFSSKGGVPVYLEAHDGVEAAHRLAYCWDLVQRAEGRSPDEDTVPEAPDEEDCKGVLAGYVFKDGFFSVLN